jgi:hypothetical protein
MTKPTASTPMRPRVHTPAHATPASRRLKRWRLGALITQTVLGKRLDLPAHAVSAFEQGRRPITPEMVARWRSATRVE